MDVHKKYNISVGSDGEYVSFVCRRNYVSRPLLILWTVPTSLFLLISLWSWVMDGPWSIGTIIVPFWAPLLLYILWRIFGRVDIECVSDRISFHRSLFGIVFRRREVLLESVEKLLILRDHDEGTPTTFGLWLVGPVSYALLRDQTIERCDWLAKQLQDHYTIPVEIENGA